MALFVPSKSQHLSNKGRLASTCGPDDGDNFCWDFLKRDGLTHLPIRRLPVVRNGQSPRTDFNQPSHVSWIHVGTVCLRGGKEGEGGGGRLKIEEQITECGWFHVRPDTRSEGWPWK